MIAQHLFFFFCLLIDLILLPSSLLVLYYSTNSHVNFEPSHVSQIPHFRFTPAFGTLRVVDMDQQPPLQATVHLHAQLLQFLTKIQNSYCKFIARHTASQWLQDTAKKTFSKPSNSYEMASATGKPPRKWAFLLPLFACVARPKSRAERPLLPTRESPQLKKKPSLSRFDFKPL